MSNRARSPHAESGGEESPAPPGGVLAALEGGLAEVLPGLDVLDRELRLDDGGRADLVALDSAGRLTLVLLAQDSERAVLEVLDLLALVRAHPGLFARHLRDPRLRRELDPRLVLVSPDGDRRLADRLLPLHEHGVELFAVRTLSSAGGERAYLVPLVASATGAALDGRRPDEAFVDGLPDELRALARTAITRLARLDDELELETRRGSLVWRLRGETIVRLEHGRDGLRGLVGSDDEAWRLDGPAGATALDRLLEGALARLVALLPPVRTARGPRAGGSNGPASFELALPEDDEAPAPGGLADEPLLSAEELEAFRD